MNTSNYIACRQDHFDRIVHHYLPSINKPPIMLHDAMYYAVSNGGKRIRPLLVYATGEMLGADVAALDKAACCIEFIHTYSLIHDDLPAMDNADLRRGKPTCHKKYGEATAILAGNALQSLAFELIAKDESVLPPMRLEMLKIVSHMIGSEGVLGGQILDLKAQSLLLDLQQIENIHRMKTAALMVTSVLLGAFVAGCREEDKIKKLERLAYNLGLAFQIGDDIVDQDEDCSLNYANRAGSEKAYQRMEALYSAVFEDLSDFECIKSNTLYSVIHYIKALFDSELKLKM